MNEADLIEWIAQYKLFAVVRAPSAETALRAAVAAMIGGIKLIEVSLLTPGSFRVISDLRHQYGDRACVGAGAVMSYEQVDRAAKCGAQFISMPHTSGLLIDCCRRRRVPMIIGALTPTEVAAAWTMGVPMVTVFPAAALGGPEYFNALASRMPDVRLAAAGGIGPENLIDYMAAGAFALSIGRSLFTSGDVQNENYAAIAERARGLLRLAGVAGPL